MSEPPLPPPSPPLPNLERMLSPWLISTFIKTVTKVIISFYSPDQFSLQMPLPVFLNMLKTCKGMMEFLLSAKGIKIKKYMPEIEIVVDDVTNLDVYHSEEGKLEEEQLQTLRDLPLFLDIQKVAVLIPLTRDEFPVMVNGMRAIGIGKIFELDNYEEWEDSDQILEFVKVRNRWNYNRRYHFFQVFDVSSVEMAQMEEASPISLVEGLFQHDRLISLSFERLHTLVPNELLLSTKFPRVLCKSYLTQENVENIVKVSTFLFPR